MCNAFVSVFHKQFLNPLWKFTEQNRTLLIQNISDHSQVAYENKYIILKQFACDVLQQNDIHVHNSFRMLEQEECTASLQWHSGQFTYKHVYKT